MTAVVNRARLSKCHAKNSSNASFATAIADFSHQKIHGIGVFAVRVAFRKERTRFKRCQKI